MWAGRRPSGQASRQASGQASRLSRERDAASPKKLMAGQGKSRRAKCVADHCFDAELVRARKSV